MKKVHLGQEGLAYIDCHLRNANGLSAFLRARIGPTGVTFAPVPNSTPEARAHQFDVGGAGFRKEVYSWFVNYIRGLRAGLFVVQDLWTTPNDVIARPPTHDDFFVCDGGVYYFTQTKVFDEPQFERIMKQITSFAWLGVYVPHDFGTYRLTRGFIQNSDLLKIIAERTAVLAVNAFDQDGLILWQPKGTSE